MIVVDFHPMHLTQIDVQPAQADWIDTDARIIASGQAWTALVGGEVIGCAGVLPMWAGRGYLWALLSRHASRHMLALTRVIRERLPTLGYRRLELVVDAEFRDAFRWALMLGFDLETPEPMQGYSPAGKAAYQFARVF